MTQLNIQVMYRNYFILCHYNVLYPYFQLILNEYCGCSSVTLSHVYVACPHVRLVTVGDFPTMSQCSESSWGDKAEGTDHDHPALPLHTHTV